MTRSLIASLGRTAAVLAAVFFAALPACVIDDVNFAGKTCQDTCPSPLKCIEGKCATVDSKVFVTNFRAEWATPHSIRWGWDPQGNLDDLASYELMLTSTTPGANGAKTWTRDDLAELGGPLLKRSTGDEVVRGTITYELTPSTVYTAVLTVHDTAGHTFSTTPLDASTDASRTKHITIFDGAGGDQSPGYLLPGEPEFILENGVGTDGGWGLHFDFALTTAGDPYANLRIQGEDQPFTPDLTDHQLAQAYLEFWIRGQGEPASGWSDVWIQLGNRDGAICENKDECNWAYSGYWVYHADRTNPQYRRVEVPLTQLRNLAYGTPLTFAEVSRHVEGFNAGCPYSGETDTTDLDEIAIWW